MHIDTDRRNLAYIFDPKACVSSVAKTTAQLLYQWKAVLGKYDYTMIHIARDRNCWEDLLWWWVTDLFRRGAVATFQRLSEYCCRFHMEEHVTEFFKQCLHCMDSKAGEKVPRQLVEIVHGTSPAEVVHFDYLYVGATVPSGDDGLDEEGRHRYILVATDDMSNWV